MFLMASYLTCPSELLLAAGNMFLVSPDLVTDIGSFAYGPSKKTNKQKKQNPKQTKNPQTTPMAFPHYVTSGERLLYLFISVKFSC